MIQHQNQSILALNNEWTAIIIPRGVSFVSDFADPGEVLLFRRKHARSQIQMNLDELDLNEIILNVAKHESTNHIRWARDLTEATKFADMPFIDFRMPPFNSRFFDQEKFKGFQQSGTAAKIIALASLTDGCLWARPINWKKGYGAFRVDNGDLLAAPSSSGGHLTNMVSAAEMIDKWVLVDPDVVNDGI